MKRSGIRDNQSHACPGFRKLHPGYLLLALHEEWADALHGYETQGVAIKRNHTLRSEAKEKGYMRMAAVMREKTRTESTADRKLLTGMLKDMAQTHGLNYQTDLLDDVGQPD